MSEAIKAALDCINKEHLDIPPEKERYFEILINQIIVEEVPINPERDRISVGTVANGVTEALVCSRDSINPIDEFNDRIDEFVSDIKRGGYDSYTVIFPLNMQEMPKLPSSFEVRGHELQKIPSEKWLSEYQDSAGELVLGAGRDKMLFEFFSSNDTEDGYDDRWTEYLTYWKVDCDANDSKFAMEIAQDLTSLLTAKINYAYHLWRFPPVRAPAPFPRARWSRLQEPFLFLAHQEEFVGYHIIDVERRRPEGIEWGDDDFVSRFNRLPKFPFEVEGINKVLVNSLLAYQQGITAKDNQQSYFSLWRGVENLAQLERSQSVEEAVERGIFALEHLDPDAYDPALYSIRETIFGLRNELTHEGVHVSIPELVRKYLKLIFDGLFELYLVYLEEFNSKEIARDFFHYNMKSEEAKVRIREVLDLGKRVPDS